MLRNWNTLALCSLLAAQSAAPAPVTAQDSNLDKIQRRLEQLEQKDASRSEALEKMQRDLKQIDEIRKSLQGLPTLTQADVDKMNKRLEVIDEIRKDLQRLEQLETLHKDLAQLGTRVKAVEERKAPPEVGANNQDLRGDIKRIEGMLNQIIDMQNSAQSDIQGMRKDVSGLRKDVTALQDNQAATKLRLDALELQLNRLTDDLKAAKRVEVPSGSSTSAGFAPAPVVERALDDIRAKLTAIEQAILRLHNGTSRSAYYGPTPAAPLNGGTGRVLLENFYPEDMLFVVNGNQTRVQPNQVVALDAIPNGMLTYEVISPSWGRRVQKTTTLASNETFRITAR